MFWLIITVFILFLFDGYSFTDSFNNQSWKKRLLTSKKEIYL